MIKKKYIKIKLDLEKLVVCKECSMKTNNFYRWKVKGQVFYLCDNCHQKIILRLTRESVYPIEIKKGVDGHPVF